MFPVAGPLALPSKESLKYPALSASRYSPKIHDSFCSILIPTNLNLGEEDRNCLFCIKMFKAV